MSGRKPISTGTRFEIFKRDNFTCAYCGRTPPAVILHVDHIDPIANGGTNDRANLITSCSDCNLGKSANPLGEKLRPLTEQIAAETERAEQLKYYGKFLRAQRARRLKDFREVSDYIVSIRGSDPAKYSISGNLKQGVEYFLKNLPVEEILEAVDLANSRIGFKGAPDRAEKYFYGICHHKIKGVR